MMHVLRTWQDLFTIQSGQRRGFARLCTAKTSNCTAASILRDCASTMRHSFMYAHRTGNYRSHGGINPRGHARTHQSKAPGSIGDAGCGHISRDRDYRQQILKSCIYKPHEATTINFQLQIVGIRVARFLVRAPVIFASMMLQVPTLR